MSFFGRNKKNSPSITERLGNGRGDKIRTCDILLPKQTLYQAEPRPDNALNVSGLCCRFQAIKACRRLLTPNAAPRPRLIPKRRGF